MLCQHAPCSRPLTDSQETHHARFCSGAHRAAAHRSERAALVATLTAALAAAQSR